MASRAGVGFSNNPDSRAAGIEAAIAAMEEAGISKCNLVLIYSTSRHDPDLLRNGVRSITGPDARLIGGYAMGIITRDRLGYDGFEVGVTVISSDTMKIDMFIEEGMPNNEFNAGVALGKQIKSGNYDGDPYMLLMFDAIKGPAPEGIHFNLNFATPLLAGMQQSLGTFPITAGVGMMGDMQSNPTYQWFDDRIEQDTVMALILSGGVQMDTIIMHGCKPASDYHTITKTDSNYVLEIDDKPAMDVINELVGADSYDEWADMVAYVTLGVNKGDKFGEFREEDYANRLAMGTDRSRGALIMFEPDLKEGHEVQLMRRSFDFGYIRERSKILLDRVGDRNPFFAFYIDCAGRASGYSGYTGAEGEEAEMVQEVIGSRMPLLGMYSGVEIAEVGSEMQALDWTGVLCIFSD